MSAQWSAGEPQQVTSGETEKPTYQEIQRRLEEAEANLQAVIDEQVDAVVDAEKSTPLILRQAQEALRRSEGRYHRLIQRMSAVIFELAPDGTTLVTNDAVTKLTGYTPEELHGRNWWEVFFPDEERHQVKPFLQDLTLGDVTNYPITLKTKTGSRITLELNSANYYDQDGRLEKIVGFGVNITDRKGAEEELIRSQKALAQSQQIAHLGSWVWDIPSNTVTMSEELYRIFGLSPQEFKASYEGLIERMHPQDKQKVENALRESVESNKRFSVQHRIVRSDGQIRCLLARGEVILNKTGEPVRMVGTWQDISEWVQAEQALRESEERFRIMVESVQDYAIFTLDPEGNVMTWNTGAEKIKQYKTQEIVGKNFSIFYPPETQALASSVLKKAAEEGRYEEEGWRMRKDGSRFWANIVVTTMRDQTGNLRGYTKVVRDMTRRKQNEEAVQRQTELVHLLQEVAVAANESAGVRQAAQFALDRICDYTGWEVGHAYALSTGKTQELVSLKVWHLSNPERFKSFQKMSEEIHFTSGLGLAGRVLETGQPAWVKDITRELHYPRAMVAKENQVTTAVAVPILSGKTVSGVMEFFTTQEIVPDQGLLDLMLHIGTLLGRVVEREQNREALLQSEARFRTIFNGAALGIELVDMNGRLIEVNPSLAKILGYQIEELRMAATGEIEHPANMIVNNDLFREMQAGHRDNFRLEKPYMRSDGGLGWGRLLVSLVRTPDGKPSFAIGMLEDITERRQMEAELAELQRRLMEGREIERLQLAQELHDGPMQELYGISYNLQALRANLENEPDSLQEMQESLQHVVRNLRTTCGELRPPSLAPFGLEKAIRSHIERFRERYPEIEVSLNLVPDGQMLPEQVRLALFRIYQQTITNVARHSGASRVVVRLELDAETVSLEVLDNGEGFDLPKRWIEVARQGHLGLVGAFERAQAIGGQMEVKSSPGEGTLVRVVAPY